MGTEIVADNRVGNAGVTGTIVITSPHENVIANCCRGDSLTKNENRQRFAQICTVWCQQGEGSFWGAHDFLSWYADEKQIAEEISEIHDAIVKGLPTYELKYSVKVKKTLVECKNRERLKRLRAIKAYPSTASGSRIFPALHQFAF